MADVEKENPIGEELDEDLGEIDEENEMDEEF